MANIANAGSGGEDIPPRSKHTSPFRASGRFPDRLKSNCPEQFGRIYKYIYKYFKYISGQVSGRAARQMKKMVFYIILQLVMQILLHV